jgi:gamma-glutamyl:cysteine ligase YbdK (ATP-grasp superfamily)
MNAHRHALRQPHPANGGHDIGQIQPALIAAVKVDIKSDEVKHDIIESMLEIATGVCENIGLALSHWLQLTGHNS